MNTVTGGWHKYNDFSCTKIREIPNRNVINYKFISKSLYNTWIILIRIVLKNNPKL